MMLNAEERDYVLDLLTNAHKELLHELHHSDTSAADDVLKRRVALNERLQEHIRNMKTGDAERPGAGLPAGA